MSSVLRMSFFLCAGCAAWAGPAVTPAGDLQQRIALTQQRILIGETPKFTEDFVLADVALKPEYPRRFSEYSGDLSGRVIGALAMMPPAQGLGALDALVKPLLTYQRPDGRFGDPALEFKASTIEMKHMALLWGNGRLLVGLLEYHAARPDAEVLAACKKLADFIGAVRAECAKPEAIERVKNLGAAGTICFTQLIEGLVLLSQATGDKHYLDEAAAIVPSFDLQRGEQHSHGYLSTLRGMLMLAEATQNTELAGKVEQGYTELVASPDLQVYGGVQEFFGGKGIRDEGCSEADMLRLSLQLWRVTGKTEYLNRSEHILYNQFYASQFATGDFGHHVYFYRGMAPIQGVGRAWWCCTMHGLRAFRDVVDQAVREKDGLIHVDLFESLDWSSGSTKLLIRRTPGTVKVVVNQAAGNGVGLAFRVPSWATLRCSAAGAEKAGYWVLDAPLKSGQSVEVAFDFKARVITNDGKALALAELPEAPTDGVLMYGPWIMGVDEIEDPQFYGEPWEDNIVRLPAALTDVKVDSKRVALKCKYIHGGFPDVQETVLYPMQQVSFHRDQYTFAARLRFQR